MATQALYFGMLLTAIDVGLKNLAYCTVDADTKRIVAWEVFDVQHDSEDQLPTALHAAMSERPLAESGLVLVEKQPRCNPKMRCVEAMLKYHFAVHGTPCRSYAAVHKLNHECSGRGNYAARKRLSIQMTRQAITEEQQSFRDLFEQSRKKDDLGDTYLMCMSYLTAPAAITDAAEAAKPAAAPGPVPARAPTTKQQRTKRYSAANVKHLLRQALVGAGYGKASPTDEVRRFLQDKVLHQRGYVPLTRALLKHFRGGLEEFMERTEPLLINTIEK